ncbi:hypothetical protein EV191_11312 [Tamaricihabitans halophyticus]|uniref:ABC-2 family transporter n=1 Tax=Tamaricihabitans halophyticus TaxID=1262583 RepID=A0A4V2SSG8_9PSEU|nr:ABC transporter permease [Tamaricihabitans halophyticus]TCP46736.1 hypothetical protein EV191_11312 [Tamaricihabitans halophyticus]
MSGPNTTKPGALVSIAVAVGAVAVAVLGILTFGVQTTAAPDGVPLAVAVPEQGPAATALRPVAQRVAGQGGEEISWTATTPERARAMLTDKDVYGVLELAPSTDAAPGLAPTVLTSGAINPSGTQLAQQVLTSAAQGVSQAASAQGLAVQPVQAEQLHEASSAARSAPLAVTALSWIGCLAAGAVCTMLFTRGGRVAGLGSRLSLLLGSAVLVTGASAGLLAWWDGSLPLDTDVLGFMLLIAGAFAAVQGALLRLLKLRAMAVLAPLYLMAPSVAGQVPELLNPAYRAALWSWTPFRFSTEGLRSVLQGTPGAPDVRQAVWVLGGMLLAGLIVLLWPGRRGSAAQQAQPDAAERVVPVGVH